MNIETSKTDRAVSRPKVTLLMALCGVAAGAAGVAGAATSEDVPRMAVRYDHQILATDSGARTVYRRIVKAAENVCPQRIDSRFVTAAVQECRKQAIERAVHEINSPRLVALHNTSANRG